MKSFLYYTVSLFFLAACTSTNTEEDKNSELKTIDALEKEIVTLAESSTCSDGTVCSYIAFGSKPCGGPWSYLVYSSSIDTQNFIDKVEQFNEMQHAFNSKHGITSDCSFVSPPSSISCLNNKCEAVYN